MSERMKRFYRKKARSEIFSELWEVILFSALAAVILLVLAWSTPGWQRWAMLSLGAVLGCCSFGLLHAAEWARRLAGTVFGITALACVVLLIQGEFTVGRVVNTLIYFVASGYLLKDSTRRTFAVARGEEEDRAPSSDASPAE